MNKIMKVSQKEAEQLRWIRSIVETELERGEDENDVKGIIDDRLIPLLTLYANWGEDIAIARGFERRYPTSSTERYTNQEKFTPRVVREVALNEFTRYLGYDSPIINLIRLDKLGRANSLESGVDFDYTQEEILSSFKEQLKGYALNMSWYSALDKVAEKVSHHWGTRLETVD